MFSTTPKILVVATAWSDHELVSQSLGTDNFHLLHTNSIADALEHLDRTIDLVLCDLRVGERGCQELMRRWHTHHPTTPFILLSSPSEVADAIAAMKAGAADYLARPIHRDELFVRIVKWLEASRKDDRLQQLESQLEVGDAEVRQTYSRIDIPAGTSLEQLERAAVENALQLHHGNRTHAARTLGISVRTLQRKLKAWQIPVFALQHDRSMNDFSMPLAR